MPATSRKVTTALHLLADVQASQIRARESCGQPDWNPEGQCELCISYADCRTCCYIKTEEFLEEQDSTLKEPYWCPSCHSPSFRRLGNRQLWHCNDCGREFTEIT